MRWTIQSQIFGFIGEAATLGMPSARNFRKPCVSKSFPAKPTIANCVGRRFSSTKLQRAGINLRLVKSPVAPKMVITQGAADAFVNGWSWFIGWNSYILEL